MLYFFSCSTQLSIKIFLRINVKMPTIVGIVKMPIIVKMPTIVSKKNSILGLYEPKKAEVLDIFIPIAFKIHD